MLKGPCRVCEDGAGGRAEPGGAAAAQGLSGSLRTQPCRLPRQAVYYWRKVTGLLAPRVPPSAGCGDGSRSALTCAAVTVNPRQPSPCRAHRAQGSSTAQLSLGTPAGSLTCYLLPLAFRFYFFFFSLLLFFSPLPVVCLSATLSHCGAHGSGLAPLPCPLEPAPLMQMPLVEKHSESLNYA